MKPFPNMDTFIMDKDEIKNESKYKKEEYDSYFHRIDNGFRLFGKYYNGLWD